MSLVLQYHFPWQALQCNSSSSHYRDAHVQCSAVCFSSLSSYHPSVALSFNPVCSAGTRMLSSPSKKNFQPCLVLDEPSRVRNFSPLEVQRLLQALPPAFPCSAPRIRRRSLRVAGPSFLRGELRACLERHFKMRLGTEKQKKAI